MEQDAVARTRGRIGRIIRAFVRTCTDMPFVMGFTALIVIDLAIGASPSSCALAQKLVHTINAFAVVAARATRTLQNVGCAVVTRPARKTVTLVDVVLDGSVCIGLRALCVVLARRG